MTEEYSCNGVMNFIPFGITNMKRLSLEELKAQQSEKLTKMNTENLESIKGGDFDWCHFWDSVRAALASDYGSAYVNAHP